MHHRPLQVFIIPRDAPPGAPPHPGPELIIEAPCEHSLFEAAHCTLAQRYAKVRAVSFTPKGMVAYVEDHG